LIFGRKNFILILTALLVQLSFAAESNNLLQNGSFEQPVIPVGSDSIENPILPGWTIDNAYSILFKTGGLPPVDGINEFYFLNGDINQIPVIIRGGHSYNLQFWAAANEIQNAPAGSYAILEAIDASNEKHELAKITFSDFISASYQWYQSSIDFTCPLYSFYAGCRLQVRFHSGGMIHLDNIILKTNSNEIMIDDFEVYGDIQELQNKWTDTYMSGSSISIEDDFENRYLGRKSLMFAYDNSYSANGYYSQIEYDIVNSPFGGNWQSPGLKNLCISFCGNRINDVNERIYLIVKDIHGLNFEARYLYSSSHFSDEKWHQWAINIEDITQFGIDTANISAIYIGFDDSDLPNRGSTPGGKGVVYLDNIKLTNNREICELPYGDVTFDGKINFEDIVLLGNWWLSEY